jgi:hypothetical protein
MADERILSSTVLALLLGCASTSTPADRPAAGSQQRQDIEVRWCERREGDCFWCAQVPWPSSRACEEPSGCNGLCFETSAGRRCMQYEQVCVDHRPLAKPEAVGDCGVTCGDSDGDGQYERCIERLSCPTRARERGFSGHYGVRHPSELYESLCAPMPEPVRSHIQVADRGEGDCDAAPLYWVITPETMRNASDATGPGLCYGVVRDEGLSSEHEECGAHHCQTLRYCDGRERAQHCTVYAQCRDDRFVPVRLGW